MDIKCINRLENEIYYKTMQGYYFTCKLKSGEDHRFFVDKRPCGEMGNDFKWYVSEPLTGLKITHGKLNDTRKKVVADAITMIENNVSMDMVEENLPKKGELKNVKF